MGRQIVIGIGGFFRAFGFALEHRLWWAFLVPVFLWAALAYGLFVALEGPVDQFTAWVAAQFSIPVDTATIGGWAGTWNDVKAFLNDARELVMGIVLKLAIAYLLFTFNKYLVLILLSPLLAYVSERAEEALTGRNYPFSLSQLLKDVLRGSLLAVRNAFLEIMITAAVWIATLFVPLLAPVAMVFLFIVSAYFYGFSTFDYVFERRRMRVGESVKAVNANMGMVLANGALFSLLMKIPLAGMCLAPPMAAIGAVLALHGPEASSTSPQVPSTR